ncbi:MAG TPA: LptA/OstA family protein, partial [Armatimonadota bacterium]|nr:LptA/OstA family protein [Armatimonadota bacterium]
VTSNKMDYDYAAKKALGTGNVVVVQKDRTVWADQGIYDQNSELVTLQGNVRMKNAGKEEIKEMSDAQTVTVSLENDFIDIVAKPGGKVTMVFEVPEDEAPSSTTKNNPPKK